MTKKVIKSELYPVFSTWIKGWIKKQKLDAKVPEEWIKTIPDEMLHGLLILFFKEHYNTNIYTVPTNETNMFVYNNNMIQRFNNTNQTICLIDGCIELIKSNLI